MFESLTEKLQGVFKRLRSKGTLTEKDVEEALREVRLVLLEADVNFRVVKDFIAKIRERAVGEEILRSLTPAQQVIKIVNEELIALLGGEPAKLSVAPKPPTVIMLAGLHGSGKTTTAGKLALLLRKQGKNPLMAAADIHRPAAVKQLETLGDQLGIKVFSLEHAQDAVAVAKAAIKAATSGGHDTVILDVAGRLHIDEEMMSELVRIKQAVPITEILLVLDAMTGQDAVNVAQQFNQTLEIDGIILTKLDSDARGGAALSARAVTGKPIKFVGVSEKPDGLEPFYPDRMASRILGMGDVLSLIERAEAAMDEEKAQEMERRLLENKFDLEDYLDQLQEVRKMGPLEQIVSMIPGLGASLKGLKVEDRQIDRVEAMIRSMTVEERRNPHILNGSRRRRIALGSGTTVQEVNRLIHQFEEMKKMVRAMAGMEEGRTPRKDRRLPPMKGLFG